MQILNFLFEFSIFSEYGCQYCSPNIKEINTLAGSLNKSQFKKKANKGSLLHHMSFNGEKQKIIDILQGDINFNNFLLTF